MVLGQIQSLKSLRSLKIHNLNAMSNTNVEILNNCLTRHSPLEKLTIHYLTEEKPNAGMTTIKFPKYLKRLKSLTLHGVWHKDFTETLFDMASQRRLRKLSLSFVKDLIMPNFSEALSKFQSLNSLSLGNLSLARVNTGVLWEFCNQLSELRLNRVNLTDQDLESVCHLKNLRTLALISLDVSMDKLRGYL